MSPRATAWGAYREITSTLRARIADGEFAPGTSLPSEAELSRQYGVARNTVRRALEQLADEGLVVARPGRGRVVASASDAAATLPQYQTIANDLRTMIEAGKLRPGDLMPSEATLAERYGAARGTVRQALAELEGADLVRAVHGKGRFVR